MVPAAVALPAFKSAMVTAPFAIPFVAATALLVLATAATARAPVRAADWVTETEVVAAVPVTPIAPIVAVLAAAVDELVKRDVIATDVPPLDEITLPIVVVAVLAVLEMTTAPVGAVVAPTLMVSAVIPPVTVTLFEEPPLTVTVAPPGVAAFTVTA